jgi:hypothetical protein
VGCANSSGSASELGCSHRVVRLGLERREAAFWLCRCCTCCSGVRSRWRRCGFARASSRSSRSWCSDMSSRFFVARSRVCAWKKATVSSSLPPASYSAEPAGRSSCALTRCLVGIASSYVGGGPTRVGDPEGPRSGRRSMNRCCGSHGRIRVGATSGSSANSPVQASVSRQRRSRRSYGGLACPRPALARSSAGASSSVPTPTR